MVIWRVGAKCTARIVISIAAATHAELPQPVKSEPKLDSTFLETCRLALLELRARLTTEVHRGEQSILDAAQLSGESSHLPTHAADQDSGAVESNVVTTEQQAELLAAVNEALERVAEGTYGQCQRCGGGIAPLRLEAIPYTPFCFPCAEKLEAEG